MSQYPPPQWPSQSPSGPIAPQVPATKQGVSGFRDSITSCVSQHEESDSTRTAQFGFFSWINRHCLKPIARGFLLLFRRKKRSLPVSSSSEKESEKENAVGSSLES